MTRALLIALDSGSKLDSFFVSLLMLLAASAAYCCLSHDNDNGNDDDGGSDDDDDTETETVEASKSSINHPFCFLPACVHACVCVHL